MGGAVRCVVEMQAACTAGCFCVCVCVCVCVFGEWVGMAFYSSLCLLLVLFVNRHGSHSVWLPLCETSILKLPEILLRVTPDEWQHFKHGSYGLALHSPSLGLPPSEAANSSSPSST